MMMDMLARYAAVGDAVVCDLNQPYPHALKLVLKTPEAAAYANNLLAGEGSGWRLEPQPIMNGANVVIGGGTSSA